MAGDINERSPPDIAGLKAIVDHALAKFPDRSSYTVRSGPRAAWVYVEPQPPSIRIGWTPDGAELAASVQSAIEREFTAKYGASLKFKNLPCGWLGP